MKKGSSFRADPGLVLTGPLKSGQRRELEGLVILGGLFAEIDVGGFTVYVTEPKAGPAVNTGDRVSVRVTLRSVGHPWTFDGLRPYRLRVIEAAPKRSLGLFP